MLTYEQLVDLTRTLRREQILSVYLDGRVSDPAKNRMWRQQLDNALTDLKTWLVGSSHAEREAFARCVEILEERLRAFRGAVGAPGWAAFVTERGVHYAEHLPVPMPTVAVWSTGLCAAPYVRALKQHRPAVIAIVDARKAAVYRYQNGALEAVEQLRAHVHIEPPSHMGDAPRPGFHVGKRGSTGRDEAQRQQHEGTARMRRELTDSLARHAAGDGWILIGGIPGIALKVIRALPAAMRERALHIESLDVHATEAEISVAAQEAASALRQRSDLEQIATIIEDAGRGGTAALGSADTSRALDRSQVRALYVTHRYLEDHAAAAEDAVRKAMDQGSMIEEVSGVAAERLEPHGGIGARLRFVLANEAVVVDRAG